MSQSLFNFFEYTGTLYSNNAFVFVCFLVVSSMVKSVMLLYHPRKKELP